MSDTAPEKWLALLPPPGSKSKPGDELPSVINYAYVEWLELELQKCQALHLFFEEQRRDAARYRWLRNSGTAYVAYAGVQRGRVNRI
jgi:hypothetical protein